jgi:hypothetical protein
MKAGTLTQATKWCRPGWLKKPESACYSMKMNVDAAILYLPCL